MTEHADGEDDAVAPAGRPVVVVGAGLAGLNAAREMQARGRRVIVVEKATHPGGRLATRQLGGATLDFGAQFFTARSDEFKALVDQWQAEGCPIREWAPGFAQAETVHGGPQSVTSGSDGHPRYMVGGGLRELAEHLAAAVPVWTSSRVSGVARAEDGWVVDLGDRRVEAAGLVLTCPVAQSLALLEAGEVALPADVSQRLRARDYAPCVALLAVCDGSPALPSPGAVQFAGGPVTWLADNAVKGVSAVPALTVHAAGDWSEEHYDEADAELAAALIDLVRPWLGGVQPLEVAVHRWRFSWPREPLDELVVVRYGRAPLAFAGDAFGGAKVEGATRSGLMAGRYVAEASSA